MTHYRDHDPIMQGLYYTRHVEAMTAEGLHSKGAIASELAARDIQIDTLAADRDQISLTLDVAKADRDKWFNRSKALEAALAGLLARFIVLADAAVDPVYVERVPEVIAARGALSPTAETGDVSGKG